MSFATDHACLRIRQRFGLKPTKADWAAAVLDILDGRALLLSREAWAGGTERWMVAICGQEMVVVWRPWQATIVTVMPIGYRRRPDRAWALSA